MLVDGVEMDFSRSRYQTFDELRDYCNLVASVVGRMCVRIFGFSDPIALHRADDLGMALQLTNILRDVREDAVDMQRVYLPQDELRQLRHPRARALSDGEIYPGLGGLDRATASARARAYFATGYEVLRYIPRRPAACVQTMAGIYEELLKKIERRSRRCRFASAPHFRRRRNSTSSCVRGYRARSGRRRRPRRPRRGTRISRKPATHVELFERSRLLGGRATSFEIDGVEVDNGQHVFLACCTEFVAFAQRVGMEDELRLQDRFDARILARDGREGRLLRRRTAGAATSHRLLLPPYPHPCRMREKTLRSRAP